MHKHKCLQHVHCACVSVIALLVTAEEWLGVSHKGARAWGGKETEKESQEDHVLWHEEGAHVTPCKEAGWTHVKQKSEKRTKWRERYGRQQEEMEKKMLKLLGS